MRVLLIEHWESWNDFLPNFADGFEANQCETKLISSESTDHLVEVIDEFNPDFLFNIGISFEHSALAKEKGLPVVHFLIDKIMNEQYYDPENYGGHDIVFSTYKDDVETLNEEVNVEAEYFPCCFNIAPKTAQERNYRYDVTFAGSILVDQCNEFSGYLEELRADYSDEPDMQELINNYETIIREILRKQEKASRDNTYVLDSLIRRYFPKEEDLLVFKVNYDVLEALLAKQSAHYHRRFWLKDLPAPLDVFGNSDWEQMDELDFNYHGYESRSSGDLSDVFYQSKINLNIQRIYARDGLSFRVFNVLYSEGFLITDENEAVRELFDDKKELVMYRDKEELKDLIEYYIDHESERETIARQGHKRVLKEHSFEARTAEFLSYLNNHVFG